MSSGLAITDPSSYFELIQRGVNIIDCGADPTGTNDSTQALNNAIAKATKGILFIPAGTFLHTGITLPSSITIIGAGSNQSTLKYNGSSGGIAIGTSALPANPGNAANTFVKIDGVKILYPKALLASGSKGLYISAPNESLHDVFVTTDDTSTVSPVAGTVGIDLDGCTNSWPVLLSKCIVQGQFDHSFNVRTALCTLLNCADSIGNYGVFVDIDSVASSAGAPWNTNIEGFHSWHNAIDHIYINKANFVCIRGGLAEATSSTVNALEISSSFNGNCVADGIGLIQASPLKNNSSSGTVYYNNLQWYQTIYMHNGSSLLRTSQRQIQNMPSASPYSTASTTPIVAFASTSTLAAGPAGIYLVRITGDVYNNTANDGVTVTLYQNDSGVDTVGSTSGGFSVRTVTITDATASNPIPICIEYYATNQGGKHSGYSVAIQAVTGGTVTLANAVLTIETS